MSGPSKEPSDLLAELADSFVARFRRGERPTVSEYTARHPELAERIEKLLPTLVMMERLGPGGADDTGGFDPPDSVPSAGISVPDRLGDFRILGEAGRGGMGVVYEAVQESLGRHVALKVLSSSTMTHPAHLARFHREARAAARLHHTNIVPIFGVGEDGGLHYYVMQFIRGQGLDGVLCELRHLRGVEQADGPSMTVTAQGNVSVTEVAENLLGLRSPQVLGDEPSADARQSAACEPIGPASDHPSVPPSVVDPPVSTRPDVLHDSSSNPLDQHAGSSSAVHGDRHYWYSVARIGAQIADALAYAHEQGTLHRDIKPSNVLLDLQGNAWVTDFGLAKIAEEENLTRTSDIIGTLRYMAPEQFQGTADKRSDIYSLGLTLYELLALRPAYDARDRGKLVQQILEAHPPRPRQFQASIPRDLETIVLKALSREPDQRYPDSRALADDLQRYLNDMPVQARRVTQRERLWRWCRRNPLVATLGGSVALLVVAVAVVSSVSALRLKSEQGRTQENLDRALLAENDATQKARQAGDAERVANQRLYESLVAQARAGRWSGRVGRRFDGLIALTKAARLIPQLGLGEDARREVRNEAVACMSLVDLRVDKQWPEEGSHGSHLRTGFDSRLERYARLERENQIVIRRMDDNVELQRLPGLGNLSGNRPLTLFSPNDRYLAVKGGPKTDQQQVRLWDLLDAQEILNAPVGGLGADRPLDFSPDSRTLAYLVPDRSIRIFDIAERRELSRIATAATNGPIRFSHHGAKLAVGQSGPSDSSPLRVVIYDIANQVVEGTLSHPQRVTAVEWSPDDRYLAVACYDGNVYIWDVDSAKRLGLCEGHRSPAIHVAYNHTGDMLVSAAWDSTTRLWDSRTGEQLLVTGLRGTKFTTDDQWLAISMTGIAAGRWQVATARECRVIASPAAKESVVSLAFSPDGQLLASAGRYDDGYRLWSVADGRELLHLPPGGNDECRTVLFRPDGDSLVTSGPIVQRWPLQLTGDGLRIGPPETLAGVAPANSRSQLAASMDRAGKTLVLTNLERDANVWDLASWKKIMSVTDLSIRWAEISPDGQWIASGTKHGKEVYVWNLASKKLIKRFPADGALVTFSPDGRWLAISTSGRVEVREVGTWNEVPHLARDVPGYGAIAFSPDMRLLAIARQYDVRLFDTQNGNEIATLVPPRDVQLAMGYPEGAPGIAFSPDSGQLAVGSRDGIIFLWDLRLIRQQLTAMGVDWNHPPIPPRTDELNPIRSVVVESALPAESQPPLLSAANSTDVQLEELTQAIAANPDTAVRYFRRAERYQQLGRTAEAKVDFQKAVELYARLIEVNSDEKWTAYHKRGHAHFHLRRYADAVADFTMALAPAPDDNHLLYWRGRILHELKRYEEALQDFNRALEVKPDSQGTYFRRARSHLFLEHYAAAIADFQSFLAKLPNDVAGNQWLALILACGPEDVRDSAEAVRLALKAAEKPSEDRLVLNTLAAAYYRNGEYDKALATFQQNWPPHPNSEDCLALLYRALTYLALDQPEAARADYDRGVALMKKRTFAAYYRAMLLRAAGEAADKLGLDAAPAAPVPAPAGGNNGSEAEAQSAP